VKTAATRIAPFGPDLNFTVDNIIDTDGVNAVAAPFSFTPLADFEIYYGRLAMENVYGPENISQLQMPFRLEYWNGNQFALNSDDSCTDWTTADISNTANHHTLVLDSGDFTAGEAGPLILQPDGSQGTDTLVWAVQEWLRDDLDGDGSLDDPRGLATFGVYRGHDRVIYWQER
jgi:MSHA biogenesis protein MshQ